MKNIATIFAVIVLGISIIIITVISNNSNKAQALDYQTKYVQMVEKVNAKNQEVFNLQGDVKSLVGQLKLSKDAVTSLESAVEYNTKRIAAQDEQLVENNKQ